MVCCSATNCSHAACCFLSRTRMHTSARRFGLEGCEALLPGLLALVEAGSEQGLKKVRRLQQHTAGSAAAAVVASRSFCRCNGSPTYSNAFKYLYVKETSHCMFAGQLLVMAPQFA
jgi:hypothetical protein